MSIIEQSYVLNVNSIHARFRILAHDEFHFFIVCRPYYFYFISSYCAAQPIFLCGRLRSYITLLTTLVDFVVVIFNERQPRSTRRVTHDDDLDFRPFAVSTDRRANDQVPRVTVSRSSRRFTRALRFLQHFGTICALDRPRGRTTGLVIS